MLICWYGERLANDCAITVPVDLVNQRKAIYSKIVSNCLQESNANFTHVNKTACRVCRNKDDIYWLKCKRCEQLYHHKCLGSHILKKYDNEQGFYCLEKIENI